MNAREERGLIIAAKSRFVKRRKGDLWQVPSQQNDQPGYLVNLKTQSCTCMDHLEGGHKCKHIYAAEIVLQREFEFNDDGSVTEIETLTTIHQKRTTYPQNWAKYDKAQINEKAKFQSLLFDLCKGIKEVPRPGRGRPRMLLADAVFCAVFKVYSTVSGRRCISDLVVAKDKGYITKTPCFAKVLHILESEAVTPILESLITETANPLKAVETKFAIDSSGFSGCRFDRWFDHKWGSLKSIRAWAKAHIMCGTTTNIITACEVSKSGDSPVLPKLLEQTAERFDVKLVAADMGYSSKANLELIEANGATALIPFKSNASGNSESSTWNRLFHYFQYKREEFLTQYHCRSNVESTFSMLKAKFGDSVRSKTDTAMKNEVLCKIVCHNIAVLISAMYELGIDPVFWNRQENAAG
jgi:hypothetical protein